jgi:hypothetical protein
MNYSGGSEARFKIQDPRSKFPSVRCSHAKGPVSLTLGHWELSLEPCPELSLPVGGNRPMASKASGSYFE